MRVSKLCHEPKIGEVIQSGGGTWLEVVRVIRSEIGILTGRWWECEVKETEVELLTLPHAAYIGGRMCPIGYQMYVKNGVIVGFPSEQVSRESFWSKWHHVWLGKVLHESTIVIPNWR